jgi:putative selenium metabolism protein SsnA
MLVINGKIITWGDPNQILEDKAILIENGVIKEIGSQQELVLKHPDDEKVDAEGHYVMPGNICGHTHFYGAYSRGMAIPGLPPKDFTEILGKLWWMLDKSLDLESVRYSALVCMAEAIRHGTTTLIDHHASPNAIQGSLDEIAAAARQSGLRISTCYEVTDRDGKEKADEGIKENLRFIDSLGVDSNGGLLAATFGLHASLTLSEETLQKARESCPINVGFHIHVAEDPVDEYDSLNKTGERVVDRLSRLCILGPKTIVAHAVHVDTREIELLAETETWVMHQPRSNMNNAVGIGNVESMMRAGVKVGMGNDGFSNAMWEEWKTAYLVHKLWNRDPRRMNGYDVVKMAVENNSDLASHLFDRKIGRIEPGAEADLIFVDYHPFTPLTKDNLPWHIIFGFHESMITSTMVAGTLLMHDRQLLSMDEEEIFSKALSLAPGVWKKYQERF